MRVGIIGTGFAAHLRAEALRDDGRATLVAVAGHRFSSVQTFATEFGATAYANWTEMLHEAGLDLVCVCTVNRDHGLMTRTALNLGLHVVVEYPLSLDIKDAQALVKLAQERRQLLHVEHIELLSGVHSLLQRELPGLGAIFSAQYSTLTACRPAPDRWTYSPDLFGFPLVGAVSRIHRLVDLLGPVAAVSCQSAFDGDQRPQRYASCLCVAQLDFVSGLKATVSYGKGESIWRSQRTLEIYGQKGGILIENEQAVLLRPDGAHPLDVGSRRGLFYQDTHKVLDHLFHDQPLYVSAKQMLHALAVAVAAEQSAQSQSWVRIDPDASLHAPSEAQDPIAQDPKTDPKKSSKPKI